jgi:hypothetical protein
MRTISLTLLSGALCGCANVPVLSPQLDAVRRDDRGELRLERSLWALREARYGPA